ncbi:MAG: hypothetical protein LBE24_04200 [Methylobacillus sp.]|jgi:hypothetical protein|nr:hypothetical protein [Methylobacillus sp.]
MCNVTHGKCVSEEEMLEEMALTLRAAGYVVTPPSRKILINGIAISEPLREEPNKNVEVCAVDLASVQGWFSFRWDGSCSRYQKWLADGLLHSASTAAAAHCQALISLTGRDE